jgi:L-asparagine transporter-like permease
VTDAAGWVLLAGAAAFLAAAFSPSSFVFGMSDPDEQRAFLEKHQRSWSWGQIPFAAGAVISAVGLLLLGVQIDNAAIVAAGAVATGVSLTWAEHCRLRAKSWADFLDGRIPSWGYRVFVWGTLGALAVTGIGLLSTGLPTWTGCYTLGATALFAAWWLKVKDLPPFVFYLVTGVLGAVAV